MRSKETMKKIFRKITILIALLIIVSSAFLFTACSKQMGRVVDKDTVYYIDTKKSSIKGFDFRLLVNKKSNITLRKDGTATLQVKLIDGIGSFLNLILPEG